MFLFKNLISEECCSRVVVKASGPAKDDQSIYLGVYRQIINYNEHAAYELEGSDQLYIYFFCHLHYNFFLCSYIIQMHYLCVGFG